MKYLAATLAGLLLLPTSAFAAIAFDTSGATGLVASPVTLVYGVTGTNPILFAVPYGSSNYASSCTYNGSLMTRLADFIHPTIPDYKMSVFYIIGVTGSNTISCSGTGNFSLLAASYNGAAQTGIPDATTTNSNSSTVNITTSLTTGSNAWIFTAADIDSAASSDGTNYTQRQSSGDWRIGDSNGAVTGATNVTITSASANHAVILVSFLPAASAATPVSPLIMPIWW